MGLREAEMDGLCPRFITLLFRSVDSLKRAAKVKLCSSAVECIFHKMNTELQ